ncbi:hypothetical protein [Aquabacterium humicola]|uniref:hypothetical protein n=1 Tax=Aquabacterium humicola TaxID=3237377 RepID=UPI002543DCC0|nr:hypothetical protein [Rubrivivax pictus]
MPLPTSLLAAAVLTFSCACVVAVEVRFGSLQLDWPEGFTPSSSKPPFEMNGPSGEKVLVTVMRSGKEVTAESAPAEQERMAQGGEGFLRKQGEKVGKVVIPLTRSSLPNGSLLMFTGSETAGLFSSGYFLQYMIVSPAGRLAFFTIEGKGSPEEQNARFLPVINTATWLP